MMAGSERVQDYLQKHKIGPLFEDLMAKVISDMPEEPCVYLSRILQLRAHHGNRQEGKSSMKKSGEFDSIAVTKKIYDKPWQTNTKRQTKDPLSPTKSVKKPLGPKPEWNARTKVPQESSNFEDLWDDSRTAAKNVRPGSPDKRGTGGATAWRDGEAGEDVMFCTYGYRGPRTARRQLDDPLSGEMGLMSEPPQKPTASRQIRPGKKGSRGVTSANHKAVLQEYVTTATTRDSGYEDGASDDTGDSIELLEDEDDLRREGVLNVKRSGVRVSRASRRQTTPQTNVRVSICATCAKVMGGARPSEPLSGARFADTSFDDFDQAPERKGGKSLTARFPAPASDDDDEFESVSQVTGPRRPVWQDSDVEAVTPRKGASMFSSNLSPNKGLPMYSTTPRRGQKTVNQSEAFFESRPQESEPLRRTWGPMGGNNDYSQRKEDQTPTTPKDKSAKDEVSVAASEGGGWKLPPDYDTDSSFYGSPGAQTQRADRAY